MRGRNSIRHSITVFCCLLAPAALAPGQERVAVPASPRDLKFSPLDFQPPKAAAYRQVLANRVVGYFVENHELPLVNISVTVRTGSYLDPAGKAGLAAAVGRLMRSGGTERYKAEDFDEEADFLAANISSAIGPTEGVASVNFLAKDTDKALELFFAMLRNPAFRQDRLDLYKSQQLQQIERRNDRTDSIESREWNRLLRGEDFFTSILPTKASVSSLTREDLLGDMAGAFLLLEARSADYEASTASAFEASVGAVRLISSGATAEAASAITVLSSKAESEIDAVANSLQSGPPVVFVRSTPGRERPGYSREGPGAQWMRLDEQESFRAFAGTLGYANERRGWQVVQVLALAAFLLLYLEWSCRLTWPVGSGTGRRAEPESDLNSTAGGGRPGQGFFRCLQQSFHRVSCRPGAGRRNCLWRLRDRQR